ncbi:methyl-accepting chemotaxis protein [Aestuariibius sp. HNIBRBA575]|uniref:methyl-accepting chemotaxis protein n=1 Tax=Aestuariibius sp. HNIBRBA575 TaxID=3233343 RepID=UPI0034A4821A
MVNEAENNFKVIVAQRKQAIDKWLASIDSDIRSLADSSMTRNALQEFASGWDAVMGDHREILQGQYIEENPYPIGEKHLLDRAEQPSYYNMVHGDMHGTFRTVQQSKGYYDIFLFDLQGNLVYSVFKETDFATNFRNGPFADSGLGEAFRQAVANQQGEVSFIDFSPYAPSMGAPASFISMPVVDDRGTTIGVLAFQMPVDRMVAIVNDPLGLGHTGEIILVAQDGTARNPSMHGDYDILDPVPDLIQFQNGFSGVQQTLRGVDGLTSDNVLAVSNAISFYGTTWSLVAEDAMSELLAPANAMGRWLLVLSLLATVLLCLASIYIGLTIARPISAIADQISQIAQGDLSSEIEGTSRGDEIGDIAKTLQTFKDGLKEAEEARAAMAQHEEQKRVVDLLVDGLAKMSEGDLTQYIDQPLHQDYEILRESYNLTLDNMNLVMEEVIGTSSEIKLGAEEIRSSSNSLARRTEKQAATLEEASASLNQITEGVQQTADQTKSAETRAIDAQKHANETMEIVSKTTDAMARIQSSSNQIERIISVIEDIAFQTNLLALNAAVEAARAGESGRGFAVVAMDVRNLAQRSSESAREIKEIIDESQAEVANGVTLVGETGDALTGISTHVEDISGTVTQIATGTDEQSGNLIEVNAGVAHLDDVTQQNAAAVEEFAAGSQMLYDHANNLDELVSKFSIKGGGQSAIEGASEVAA